MKNITPSVVLVFSHDNKIGDAVLLTSLVSPIKSAFPKTKIIVMAGRDNSVIWKNHPLIDKTYTLHSRNILTRLIFSLFIRHLHPTYGIVTSGENQGKSFSLMRKVARVENLIWVGTEPPEFKKLKDDSIQLGDWGSKHYLERCWEAINQLTGLGVKSYP
jgi:ADP-heptose:LPS heptosyltransferase